jgi:hypothetical protein
MKRKSVVFLAALTLVAGTGVAVAAVGPPGINGPGLAAVGPISPVDGFPIWYQDNTGVRLQQCGVLVADPNCPATAPLPNGLGSTPSFPTNYTPEAFYQLASVTIPVANAGRAVVALNLEQSLLQPVAGQQITFSRLRVDINGAVQGVNYKVTTPAGVTNVVSAGTAPHPGNVFTTVDTGAAVGNFSGALGGHVGPFLKWDPLVAPLAPAGYIGDGFTAHKVVGSPYGTNFVRIEAIGVNPTPLTDGCPTLLTAHPFADCVETSLFTLQGKIATTSGVVANRATYTRTALGGATGGFVDAFASSLPQSTQAITVSDVPVAPALGEFGTTELTGSAAAAGHYFARVPYVGAAPPTTVKVSNIGDVPASSANMPVTDAVTGTAVYTTGTPADLTTVPATAAIPGSLAITAVSSDALAPTPVLTASGIVPAAVPPALPAPMVLVAGVLAVPLLDAPPPFVTVTSAAGGTVQLPVTVLGAAYAPVPAVSQAGPAQTAAVGQLVTLNGSASTGALTFAWTAPAGITLLNPATATPTFTPTALNIGANVFTLTVTGLGGTTSTSTVTVTVTAAAAAVANAGLNQIGIQRGSLVTLNGSLSSVGSYLWTQVVAPGDPVATLTGATTLQPTFAFPFYKSPANKGLLTFNLKVTSINGSIANSTVTISPTSDTVVVTRSVYTVAKGTWLSAGTSSILAGQIVTLHLGLVTGPVIGTAVVDPTGAFQIRGTTPPAIAGSQVTAESQLGGVSASFPVKVQ